jgi:hypothetical protein
VWAVQAPTPGALALYPDRGTLAVKQPTKRPAMFTARLTEISSIESVPGRVFSTVTLHTSPHPLTFQIGVTESQALTDAIQRAQTG